MEEEERKNINIWSCRLICFFGQFFPSPQLVPAAVNGSPMQNRFQEKLKELSFMNESKAPWAVNMGI